MHEPVAPRGTRGPSNSCGRRALSKLRSVAPPRHTHRADLDAMSRYRFPPGVKFLGKSGNEFTLAVDMPDDDEGFFGRECPSCRRHFRIASDDYEALPDEQMLWCVYCGNHDDHDDFITAQQMARLERAATNYAEQMATKMLEETFGKMSRRSRGSRDSFIQVSWDVEPFRPRPLPGINEERLIRERACPDCGLRYAVFAEHRYCPVCGQLPALATALDSLAAETVRLDALADSPPQLHAELREAGVLDRTYVDTIENAVAIVETLAERTFKNHVKDAEQILRGCGQVFQRLNDLADLYDAYLGIDLPAGLGPAWPALHQFWAARHVFTHCDGIIDSKYLGAVGDSPMRQGQRLTVSESMARAVLRDAELLCRALDPAPNPAVPAEPGDEGSDRPSLL